MDTPHQPSHSGLQRGPATGQRDANYVEPPLSISIIVSVRGPGDLLPQLLAALGARQDVGAQVMEVILVVGRHVRTKEWARPQRPRHRLRLLEIVESAAGSTRDAGWRAAESPLLLFLDDDVVPARSLVVEHLRAHRDHGPCVVLGRVEPPAGRRQPWIAYDDRILAKKQARLGREEVPSGIHYGGNFSLPREFLQRVGGHDHALPQDADVELGDRHRAAGVGFVYHPAALTTRHGGGRYEDWRRRHFIHGRVDVALRRDRGLSGGLPGLLACYYDRHPLNRFVVRLGLGRRTGEGGLSELLVRFGTVAAHLHMDRLSFAAFSAAANLLYWSGVRDAMRGSPAFWKAVRSLRNHSGRPYLVSTRQ